MGNIICYLLVAFIMVGTGNMEYIKSNEVNNTPATWNELGYDEYLATAWEGKNLNESELCSLKHMGFSKDEIQKCLKQKQSNIYMIGKLLRKNIMMRYQCNISSTIFWSGKILLLLKILFSLTGNQQ